MQVKKTRLLVILILILSQLIIRLPDFIRWQNTPSDLWFTGQASWFDPWDLNVYFSAIGWGRRDGILFENTYDTNDTPGMPIYSVYTLLGKLSAFSGLSNATVFHIGGVVAVFWLAYVVWWFIQLFIEKQVDRIVAFIIIFLGGGLGWFFFPKILLPDIGQPGFILSSAIRRPHEALSYSFFLLTLGNFLQGLLEQKKRHFFAAAFALIGMLFFHPYSILPISAAFVIFAFAELLKNNSTRYFLPLLIVFLLGGVYYLVVGRRLLANPSFVGLATQVQSSPAPLEILGGFGLLTPFILIGLFTPGRTHHGAFLKTWFVVHSTVIYVPLGFQRLLIRGLWIAAVMLAVKGLREICHRKNFNYQIATIMVVLIVSISSLHMSMLRITESAENRWIYLTKDEGKIIEYLRNHGADEEGVLASYRVANIIPAQTTKRVWAGHTFQSPEFNARILEVKRFYAGIMSESEAKKFLQKANIIWVFWGPDEKSIAKLEHFPYFVLVESAIETSKASLYRVL